MKGCSLIFPLILLFLSVSGIAGAIVFLGPVISLPLIAAMLSAMIALILLARAWKTRRTPWIVVDGSNVMHWDDETPALETVDRLVRELVEMGFVPLLWFDANVGYKVGDSYMGPERLSRRIGVPARRIFVAPKGTPADPLLLRAANRLKAPVVTNDRFRDWVEHFPQVQDPGFLVRGRVRKGKIILNLVA